MKKALAILFMMAMAFSLWSCNNKPELPSTENGASDAGESALPAQSGESSEPAESQASGEDPNGSEDTEVRLFEGGTPVCYYDGRIYYAHGNNFASVRPDGTDRLTIGAGGSGVQIGAAAGGKFFYVCVTGDNGLFRYDIKTGENGKIFEGNVNINAYDDKTLFVCRNENGGSSEYAAYAIDVDTENAVRLAEGVVHSAVIGGDSVYYTLRDDVNAGVGRICRAKLNGSGSEYFCDWSYDYYYADGYIYAGRTAEQESEAEIHRVNAVTGEDELVVRGATHFAVEGGKVFYYNALDENRIWSIGVDGSEATRISDRKGTGSLTVIGGKLYFGSYEDSQRVLVTVSQNGDNERVVPGEGAYALFDCGGKTLIRVNAGDFMLYDPQDGSLTAVDHYDF